MNKTEQKKFDKALRAHNDRLEAEHRSIRDQIMALRPSWSRAQLDLVVHSYGHGGEKGPGLWDILNDIRKVDAHAARFGVQS